jgi:acetyl-CoA carboxylase carboxyl transferase subunit beta
LHKKGVIDAVVGLDELPELASRILRLLDPGSVRDTDRESFHVSSGRIPEVEDAWEAILISRHPGRPSTREVLEIGADDHVELAGTGAGEVGTGMVLAVASFDGQSCIVVGHDRRSRAEGLAGPAGLRMARRGIRLAGSLGLPVVTVIDTPGAELSARSEEGALAGEIARCVEDLAGLTVPTVSILLGEGGGGAALALLPAERTIAAEHAWLAPLPPEGGSAIVHRDTRHAPQIARSQGIGARALLSSGTVDCVVREPIPAHLDSARFVKEICHAARRMLVEQMRPDRDGHARAPRVPVP